MVRGVAFLAGFAAVALLVVLAWWLALLLVAAAAIYAWLRGGADRVVQPTRGPTVIEGDYVVERDSEPPKPAQ